MTEKKSNGYTIALGGPVNVMWQDYTGDKEKEITDIDVIKSFDGYYYSDGEGDDPDAELVQLCEYLQDGDDTSYLYELGVRKGYIYYDYSEESNELYLIYEYSAPRELTEEEIKDLSNFTLGQITDGAGPAFSADLMDMNDGIAPSCMPEELRVFQCPDE